MSRFLRLNEMVIGNLMWRYITGAMLVRSSNELGKENTYICVVRDGRRTTARTFQAMANRVCRGSANVSPATISVGSTTLNGPG